MMLGLKKFFVGVGVFCASTHLWAGGDSLPVPQDFMFNGKPIEPACIDKFTGDDSRFQPILLNTDECQKTQKKYDPKELEKGFIGYSLSHGAFIYYNYLGKLHFQNLASPTYHLIAMHWSGGGSGHFTEIDVIEKKAEKLRLIDTLEGGDRCNGGLAAVEFKNDVLSYRKHLTPLALYSLALEKSDMNIDFSDCAICCLGDALYKGREVMSFEFNKDSLSILENNSNSSTQKCYNEIIRETLNSGKYILTPDEIKSFGLKVKDQCVVTKDRLKP